MAARAGNRASSTLDGSGDTTESAPSRAPRASTGAACATSPTIVKRCACGREYAAETWRALPFVGTYDDGVEALEMRNCACKSTLALVVRACRCVACGELVDGERRVCPEAGPMHERCAREWLAGVPNTFDQPAATFAAWVRTGNAMWLHAWREWCAMTFGWVKRPQRAA